MENKRWLIVFAIVALVLTAALIGDFPLYAAQPNDSIVVSPAELDKEVGSAGVSAVVDGEPKLNEALFPVEKANVVQPEPVVIKKPVNRVFEAFTVTNYTAEDFNAFLERTTLKGKGATFVKLEQEYGVNGVFALAVLCNESGFGKFRANTNNYFGMKSGSGYMAFESPDANIMYFGKLMQKDWYRGKSIEGIAAVYCPSYGGWLSTVRALMRDFYGMR